MHRSSHFLISLILAASATSFLAGYLLTKGSPNNDSVIQEQRGALIDRFNGVATDATPTPLPPGLFQAAPTAVLAPVPSTHDDTVLYYHADNGYVSRLDIETRETELVSTTSLARLTRVIWSPDRNRVITVSQTSRGEQYSYFDYATREHGMLGDDIQDAVFSPDSQRVALVRSPTGESAIQIADFNGKNIRTILKTRLTGIRLSWPSDELSFTASDADSSAQSIYMLNENGDLSQLVEGADGLSVQWAPDGSMFLYSARLNGTTALRLYETALKESRALPVRAFAEHCAWRADQRSIICAVHTGGETSVVEVGLATNTTSVPFSNLILNPYEVFLSHKEDFLIIISAGDRSIWAVKLRD